MSAAQKAPTKSAAAAFVLQLASPGGGFFYLGRLRAGVYYAGLALVVFFAVVWACFAMPIAIIPLLGVIGACQLVSAVVVARGARRLQPTRRISERPLVICGVGMTAWYSLQLVTRVFVVEPFRIPLDSHSMEPVLFPGDQFFVKKTGASDVLEEGDIIVFRHDAASFVKRIKRGPEQAIVIDGRELWMGPGEYFVIGDNRDDSYDSRHFGPITRDAIVGKAISVWWSRGPDGVSWDQIRRL